MSWRINSHIKVCLEKVILLFFLGWESSRRLSHDFNLNIYLHPSFFFPQEDLRQMICLKETQILRYLQSIYCKCILSMLPNMYFPFLLIKICNMQMKISTCFKDMHRGCRGETHCIEMITFLLGCCVWM